MNSWHSGGRLVAEWIDITTDEEIDAAIEEANQSNDPHILEASYHPEPGLEFLMLRLSDGRRLLIPREELSELKDATAEQASEIWLRAPYFSIWWPQLDDGLYLPDFLEYRWGKRPAAVDVGRDGVAA